MSRTGPEIFRRRTAVVLTWGLLAAVMISLFFMIFGEPVPDVEPGQPDSYSTSAIGYRALVDLLRKEVPVLISRSGSGAKASQRVPLVLLEPRDTTAGLRQLQELVIEARGKEASVVLVLPKWQGRPAFEPPGWVEEIRPRSPSAALAVLHAALGRDEETGSKIARPEAPESWSSALPETAGLAAPSLALPQLLVEHALPLVPLLEASEGLLVTQVENIPVFVVADPDLLNNSGLSRADNAHYAHRLLIDHLQPTSFVVAEEIHGYEITPSVWRALLRPPLVLVTLHLAVLVALVLWAGTGRFGRPQPAPMRVAPGKGTLIENTALLLGQGGHYDESVDQYLRWTVRHANQRFAPHGLPEGSRPQGLRQQVTRLARLGKRRGVTVDLDAVARGVVTLAGRGKEPRRALALARDLYRWRKEMEDGRSS